MAKIALPDPRRLNKNQREDVRKQNAIAFAEAIESTWRGHVPFAFWIVEKIRPKTIVDLGFDRGLSTIVFGIQNKGHVFGIDWFDDANYATKCFALDTAFRNISTALRFDYARNIHLILGPFAEIAKGWNRQIDILNIDWAHSYEAAKMHFENWKPFLHDGSVIIIHDILAYPEETGRFFQELPMYKFIFPHAQGLGVASHDPNLIEEIKRKYAAAS